VETIMTTGTQLLRRVSVLSALLLAGFAVGASAQSGAVVQRWDAWMGCWRAERAPTVSATASAPYVCVSPTNKTAAVELVTIDGSKILSRDTIDASGETTTATVQGCQATKKGQFSADGRRVLLHSDVNCPDAKRTTTGILAIAPTGEWLDIQSVTAFGNTGIRVTRYRDARPARVDSLPVEVQRQLDRSLAISTARTLAGGALDVRDVAEASRLVDTSVVQAWIVERGARFKLDASSLVALAEAGVPASVTDVMVGVSYPEHFALQQPRTMGGYSDLSPMDSARIAGRYIDDRCGVYASSLYSCGRYGYGYGGLYGYGLYGYNTYGGGYYPGYGYGGYYGGFYNAPIVVVKGDQQQAQSHGRMINGVGYTPGSGSSSSGTASQPSSSGSTSGSSGSSGGSGTGSSSGASSSGSSGGGRTAIPRPPR
jgi:hypothetical protein